MYETYPLADYFDVPISALPVEPSLQACEWCGAEFDGAVLRDGSGRRRRGSPAKFCSKECKRSSERDRKLVRHQPYGELRTVETDCRECGCRFQRTEGSRGRRKLFCSDVCKKVAAKRQTGESVERRRPQIQKQARERYRERYRNDPEYRQKFLDAARRQSAEGKKGKLTACPVCGETFRDRNSSSPRKSQATCSWECAGVEAEQQSRQKHEERLLAGLVKGEHCKVSWCAHCERAFEKSGRKFCSARCEIGAKGARVNELYHLSCDLRKTVDGIPARYWRNVLYRLLVERDGPDCQLCNEGPIDLTLKSGPKGEELGPSVDHIILRSEGGPDELDNLRLTHWRCNRDRWLLRGFQS